MGIFNDLTAPHQLLCMVLVLDGIIGATIIAKGYLQRTRAYAILIIAWNAAEISLLAAGAEHSAWQYYVFGAYLLFDTLAATWGGFRGKRTNFEGKSEEGYVFFIFLMVIGLITLIVTGA